jgi:error-prone DNA polymerase
MRRGFLAVHLPGFRLERCGWDARAPAVLLASERGAERVQAVSLPAGSAGVRVGMTLAAARALLPDIRVERVDAVGELTDLEALCLALGRFTPAARAVPPDALLLEVDAGATPLVRAALTELGHLCRLVFAEEAGGALALARHARRDRVVPRGGLAAALALLPVDALELPEEVQLSLADVGIRTIGQFAALPAAALVGRYGPEIAAAHARAQGRAPPMALPVAPPREDTSFFLDFQDPVDVLEAVLFVLAGLLRDLAQALERTGQAAMRVQVRLRLEEGEHCVPVRLGQPSRGSDRIFRLLRARLERVQLASPVVGVAIDLLEAAPFRPVQPGLLDRAQAVEPLPELCARLQDVLGAEAVCVPAAVDTHRPEATWVAVPWGQAPPPARPESALPDPAAPHEPHDPPRARPALLLPDPAPIRVAAAPSGRPRALFLEREWTALDPVDGPERLAGEWWRTSSWRRDYWRVGLPDGRRAWIFREALPGDTDTLAQRWYLHGWLDGGLAAERETVIAAELPVAPPPSPTAPSPTAPSPAAPSPAAPSPTALPPAAAPSPPRRGPARPPPARYAELVCRSNYSFCEGASFPEELIERARELGLDALALTDRDGVYGNVRFHREAKGFPILHGSLLTLRAGHERVLDGGPAWSAVALVQDLTGWATLCRILTAARGEATKGRAELPLERLLEQNAGLLFLARGDWPDDALARLYGAVGERLYRAVSRRLAPGEESRIDALVRGPVPCVATNDVLMHIPERARLQDVLSCIRLQTTLDQAGRRLQPNAERVLKEPERMARLFRPWPGLVERTLEVAGRCAFSLGELKYTYPREVVPDGYSALEWLRELTRRGVRERYGPRPPESVTRQVEYELAIIGRLDFAAYFLTVHDLVRFARERGILCQGRGSAANSAVCYVLGVTAVDPARASLLFERFISEERGEPPDIDIDFEHERREEVLQYVYEKYGRDRAAMVNEVIAWRGRMAVRDVGKAVGLGLDQVDRLAKAMDGWGGKPPSEERIREAGLDPADPAIGLTQGLVGELQGFPRHTSIHVGGFVISDGPLIDRAPVEPATMENRTVIQWDKNDVDDLGFVKVDLLSLGMLTAIRKCFQFMRSFHGVHHDLATVPREDPAVYDMLCEADSTGVFQVESRAQQGMLPRLRPRCFYDLVIETAIVRPGPIQGGMVHPYLRRRSGAEPVTYVDERLRPILARTLGVPIFQEQVMAMAIAVGGFTPGEADALRRAMGAWRRRGGLGELGDKLMRGMAENGLPDDYAAQIFKQIQGFAEYGFPESHAASFAHLVYVSAWQRCHYPAAFCAALINSQPMGFYAPRSLVSDAQRHGVEVRPIDVCTSEWDCTLEPGADGPVLRVGLRLVKGLGEEAGRAVEAARAAGAFRDLPDFAARTGLDRGALLALARAGGLDRLQGDDAAGARGAVWAVEGLWSGLFARVPRAEEHVALPIATPVEVVQADYLATGLSVRMHPVGLVRSRLEREGVLPLSRLVEVPNDTPVRIAGLVSHRQRPGTASGVVFMTLEDETGTVNVVVWPKLYERQRRVIRTEPLVSVAGVLQREGEAISVVARSFQPLRAAPPVAASSRDFR